MHKILVPIDGSDHSLKALHIACDLADKYGACISLLYVLDLKKLASEFLSLTIAAKFESELKTQLQTAADKPREPVPEDVLRRVGATILQNAASRAHRFDIKTEIMPIAEGDPAENILIAHKITSAGTIVMGSRGGNFSSLSSFGSVSHKVFAKADCTCISVK